MLMALTLLPALSFAGAPLYDSIVVRKAERSLQAYQHGKPVFSAKVSLGKTPEGDKICEGDDRTPEGEFTITAKNRNSRFHKSLQISYPDSAHRARSREANCPPGGRIMLHGIKNGMGWLGALHSSVDWTQGCMAVTNAEIDTLWKATRVGTKIHILR